MIYDHDFCCQGRLSYLKCTAGGKRFFRTIHRNRNGGLPVSHFFFSEGIASLIVHRWILAVWVCIFHTGELNGNFCLQGNILFPFFLMVGGSCRIQGIRGICSQGLGNLRYRSVAISNGKCLQAFRFVLCCGDLPYEGF